MAPCPVCGKDDQTQKVTAVVEGETSHGSFAGPTGGITYSNRNWGYAGGYTSLSGTQSTNLARALTPPARPQPKGLRFLAVGFFGWLVLMVIPLLLGFAAMSNGMGGGLAVILIGCGFCLAMALLVNRDRTSRERWNKEEFPKLLAEWERKMSIYSGLYYCRRDDEVFDPVSGKHVPLKDMTDLLS